ncbi:hypothetical protein U0C82_11720 [Fulvimarina sp. 2208YS6-2-32]|uniref:Uncharacterized protein n=1 Tax=Fulvimarina uroteuthidis TaxID=3098149 RepID=A0ABU5I6P1_9HYPH|nr:hypothetical protein [Fulvimarina sp. 2208YS6-2-32]
MDQIAIATIARSGMGAGAVRGLVDDGFEVASPWGRDQRSGVMSVATASDGARSITGGHLRVAGGLTRFV